LFLQIVGLSNLKISAIEESANITFCSLQIKSLSEILQGLEQTYSKVIMKKPQWPKRFHDDPRYGLEIFFDAQGLVQCEGHTINEEMYVEASGMQ
jgi:hypothetical protein